MPTDREIQVRFLEWVKANTHSTLADELCLLLDISRDSAYRRLRGDTLLTFNEIRKIALHYNLSLDTFFQTSKSTVLFHKRTINETFTYGDFLKSVAESISLVGAAPSYRMVYVAKDIPPFHYFQFPLLSRFKSYFWLRTILKDPKTLQQPFDERAVAPEIMETSEQIWKTYRDVPSLEIWSDETMNITLRQIEYYFDTQIISREQLEALLSELKNMLDLLSKSAEAGHKLCHSDKKHIEFGKFELYHNEIEIGDNTVFFSLGNKRMVMKTYNMLNVLTTTDEAFCENIEAYIDNILQKSSLLSHSSEKARLQFFNKMKDKIDQFQVRLLPPRHVGIYEK
ncbi:helix-turn-helix domain-containing protein [Marinoscillum furvescens]|uniref:BetR domain-containing protein n=1 Tax=Marinoscillum furvescens DSM 4134 TaxID=1122208 RepID=A0A3D9KZK5_MARFU|nr:helix-turn-helix domain-containing protein [Marinoscillum furvescens]RED93844.1 BetR domain-containing protein [Marinoscillum furvescens DSM 4134]